MIIIVSPNLKRADDWARTADGRDLSKARLFATHVPFRAGNARMLGADDTVVWISGWQEGQYAVDVLAAVKPCIGKDTEIVYA